MYKQITSYYSAMVQAKQMLSHGLISAREYATIDGILLAKYGISSNSIFRDMDLLCEEVRVNMLHHKGVT